MFRFLFFFFLSCVSALYEGFAPEICDVIQRRSKRIYEEKMDNLQCPPAEALLDDNTFIYTHPYCESDVSVVRRHEVANAHQIIEGLFLGNICAAEDETFLSQHGIEVVVSVAEEWNSPGHVSIREGESLGTAQLENERIYVFYGLANDHSETTFEEIGHLSNFISVLMNKRHRVLVHGNMGIDRSATVVIQFLMNHYRISFGEAYSMVRSIRTIIQPQPVFEFLLVKQYLNSKIVSFV